VTIVGGPTVGTKGSEKEINGGRERHQQDRLAGVAATKGDIEYR
jgi:hypothetical protein